MRPASRARRAGAGARLASLLALLLTLSGTARAGEWPTLHRDLQRSGYTDEVLRGPFERKWFRDFHDEMIATRVEAIVAEGKCFVGTFAGRLHALRVKDGSTAWTFQAGGPIGHSACYHRGRLYFGADDGLLYCLNATTGDEVWRYRAGAGIWVAPACDGERVYFGDRAGVFHAVSAKTGRRLWTYKTGGMILTPASLSADGQSVVFGSEEMRVYCLSPQGKLRWRSAKLGGLSLRDHAPTLWQGLAIVRTNPANSFHHAAGQNPAVLTQAQKSLPLLPEDRVIFDQWGSYTMRLTPRRLQAEREAILRFLRSNPAEKTFYAFDLKDGQEPWTAPVLYTGGLHNPTSPPTFNPRTGELYTWMPSALSNYSAGVPGGAITVGKLDRRTGMAEVIWHANGDKLGWAFDFAAPADETQSLSLLGGTLLNTHQGIIGGLDLETRKWRHVQIARDTYGGIFGPALVPGSFQGADRAHREGLLTLMPNEWHGPDRSIASIAEGRLFWVVGSQVVCLGGPEVPTTSTGGAKAPGPIRRKVRPLVPGGNVAAGGVGDFDASLPKERLRPEQLQNFLKPPRPVSPASSPLARQLRAKLDAAVMELVGGAPWAPFIVELGLSGEERHFWRTAETMQVVSLALPTLSPAVRARAVRYLDGLFAQGVPLRMPVFPGRRGRAREPYDLGPEMLDYARAEVRYQPSVEDLYALWAYAHYADRWPRVLSQASEIRRVFQEFAAQPVQFDPNDQERDAAEHLNAQIAGTLAYARMVARATSAKGAPALLPPEDRSIALSRLADLVTERVHHERADTRLVRSTRTARYGLHQARIPRYLSLTPEVGALLRRFAGAPFRRNLQALTSQLPVWYQAYGERLIGGENYISPPGLSQGLFLAQAYGSLTPPARLARKLDQPWCRGDLYRIEKLAALLRASAPLAGRTAVRVSPSPSGQVHGS